MDAMKHAVMTEKEIAAAMGVSKSLVSKLLRSALKKIRANEDAAAIFRQWTEGRGV